MSSDGGVLKKASPFLIVLQRCSLKFQELMQGSCQAEDTILSLVKMHHYCKLLGTISLVAW